MITVDATPYPYRFEPAHTALIVIDMQRDFIEKGGFGSVLGNDVTPLADIVPTVAALLTLARRQNMLVVHTRESHLPDLSDCPPSKLRRGNPTLGIGDNGPMGRILVRGEDGCQIVPQLTPQSDELLIDKPGKGAFYATELGQKLKERGITHLLFAGVTTEVCVQTSMREANDRGYECLLIEDACASYFPDFHRATVATLTAQGGIIGWSTPFATLQTSFEKES
jgi:nicotinamidase-related amidase